MKRELEIYVHIPFCVRKCAYCDFLSAPAGKETVARYLKDLKTEIRRGRPFGAPAGAGIRPADYLVTTVFFGGGTPSLLTAGQMRGIMEALRERFVLLPQAEITMECNPGTLSGREEPHRTETDRTDGMHLSPYSSAEEQRLRAYRSCGVNRLSIGLQSADREELRLLGRIHSFADFLRTFRAARSAGFSNINVDLMAALPGQTAASWENTLKKVLALSPEHISAYSLIIEEGTPFYERYHEDDRLREKGEQPRVLPSEEEEREMYERTEILLGQSGYHRYEISNYARDGYQCRHNIGYWRTAEYMGFGLGASSLLAYPLAGGRSRRMRIKNAELHEAYAQAAKRERQLYDTGKGCCRKTALCGQRQSLAIQEEMEEFMFLGLRMIRGVSEEEFRRRFRISIEEVYADVIRRFQEYGLLERRDGRIALTRRGLDLSNQVMAGFLL